MTGTTEHEKCIKCGRRLYCAKSRARGYGWGCWRRIRAARKLAALVNFTRQQIADAIEIIEDAAIVPGTVPGLFHAVSSDGTGIYQATAGTCSCPATKACKHNAAVIMVTA
jgi:hypothetical protein